MYPDAVVRRCRKLAERGYTPSEIVGLMLDEGHVIPFRTIQSWVYGYGRARA